MTNAVGSDATVSGIAESAFDDTRSGLHEDL